MLNFEQLYQPVPFASTISIPLYIAILTHLWHTCSIIKEPEHWRFCSPAVKCFYKSHYRRWIEIFYLQTPMIMGSFKTTWELPDGFKFSKYERNLTKL
jgi:hypothetical protein